MPDTTSLPSDVLISARGLTKSFGDFTAVDGIDVEVRRGEAFGFLGPNGAGKSSTMRMIAGVSPVSQGELRIFGEDPATHGPQIRARLGVCPQKDLLDEELTVQENLWTTGLDPQARHILWDRLFRLKRQGVTLVLTTHYMDEAEQLCDRLVVMDKGRIVAEGSPRDLITQYSTREVVEVRFDSDDHTAYAADLEGVAQRAEVLPDRILLYAVDGDAAAGEVHRRGLPALSTLVRRSTLEDVFLHLTGRTLVD